LFFGDTNMLSKHRQRGDNLLIVQDYGKSFLLTGAAVRPDSSLMVAAGRNRFGGLAHVAIWSLGICRRPRAGLLLAP
jgi:hypothetical protein